MRHTLLLSVLLLALSACGIKPSSVTPPDGAGGATHPATYPKADMED